MKGVFAAVLTPMREDLSVDRAAFAEHCRRLLDAGCHGLGIFGTTGEANSLSIGERIEAWEGARRRRHPRRRRCCPAPARARCRTR